MHVSHVLNVSCSTGSISWITATPADVVKSRLQADTIHHRKYKGIIHCIIQSYKTEGLHVSFLYILPVSGKGSSDIGILIERL